MEMNFLYFNFVATIAPKLRGKHSTLYETEQAEPYYWIYLKISTEPNRFTPENWTVKTENILTKFSQVSYVIVLKIFSQISHLKIFGRIQSKLNNVSFKFLMALFWCLF